MPGVGEMTETEEQLSELRPRLKLLTPKPVEWWTTVLLVSSL
jgi:hypothetical protein